MCNTIPSLTHSVIPAVTRIYILNFKTYQLLRNNAKFVAIVMLLLYYIMLLSSFYCYSNHHYLGIALEMFHNRELSIPRIEDDFKIGTTSQSLIPSRQMDDTDYTTDMSRSSLYGMIYKYFICHE